MAQILSFDSSPAQTCRFPLYHGLFPIDGKQSYDARVWVPKYDLLADGATYRVSDLVTLFGMAPGFFPDAPVLNEMRAAMADIEHVITDRGGFYIRSFAHPFDFYAHRRYITHEQHAAGTDFAQIWHRAFASSHHAQWKYQAQTGKKMLVPGLLTEELLRFQQYYGAIRGQVERKIAIEVCCYGIPAGKRGGMQRLKSALSDLVTYIRSET